MAEEMQGVVSEQSPVVTVRSNGAKREVSWTDGMTVQQAITASGIRTKWTSKYYLDGQRVRGYQQVAVGGVITISPPIKNG
ncbi:MAG: hypothetical protein A3J54_03045 [Candidatus Ryanbacteria bacterium RIFCSPHIGHO2_02_FULL_45_13b]|uniref:TGS domain-containing protein n=1 Tax=Candidatus Ryanbacteria bacterium RIFCSPHIGHO2_02_FULL_45_13b TaxID=1802117 RepID=A0A1G2G6S7_9BACT|nr:MAG: hypothetical protein A3J54_03045 [Candidatus Ryanbacteria bacterium RIFCSPHIGHO2_02_FULL_45_13b]